MILGGVAVAGIVALFLFVLSGGEEEPAAAPTRAAGEPSPEATASPTPRDASAPGPTFSGRDPFSVPPALASPSAGASPTQSLSPTTSPTGGGPGGNLGGKDVALVAISSDGTRVRIRVDGSTSGQLAVGDEFRGVTVASIEGACTDLSVDGDSTTLCLGK